ncbi:MAG: amidohydrolase [Thermonemataceae bacterium]
MEDLTLTFIQTDIHWENPQANCAMLEEKIWQIEEETDLIILPEMFTTGFTMEAATWAEPMNLTTFKWMKQMAAQKRAVITGSYIVKEGEAYYNRLLWMRPDGTYDYYDKHHLFTMAGETAIYTPGSEKCIVSIKDWQICPLICYDLRFPVWSRNTPLAYDVLLYVANWPSPRINAWDTLLEARAIENLCYTVGVNRVGKDHKGMIYPGRSGIYNYKGITLARVNEEEAIVTQTLSKAELAHFRDKFPAHQDADAFELLS